MKEQRALYDSFIADYYDSTPLLAQRTRDIAFYVDTVKKYGEPVLELGCGSARVASAIAEAGYRVVGLDISQKMLKHADEKRTALPAPARDRLFLLEGDMTKFDVGGKFRTVIIPFRPFQDLVETAHQMACLSCVRNHLEPEGRLIFDVFQMDADRIYDPRCQQESLLLEYDLPDGRHVALSERVAAFHRAEQKNDVEMIFNVQHPDGNRERLVLAWTLRYFFRYEVHHLLARCGFRVESEYGDFDRSPLTDESPEMIFVAQVVR